MGLLRLIARRLAIMAGTMLVVSALVFLLLEYDIQSVAVKVLGPFSTIEQRDLWLERNGYFDPALTRYVRWLGGILQGDFGESVRFKRPVAEVLWPRLANTALLGAIVLAAVSVLGLGLGVIAGVNEGRPLDRIISILAVVTTSVPEFASAVLLSSVFVFWLGWLPGTSGMAAGFDPWQLVLPVMVLVLYDFGYIARLTRASMAETMRANYVRTARLKGLGHWAVVTRHALRNALIAPYTVLVLQVNWLLSGVIVVEFFFAYKGFGALLLEASLHQDLYLIQACAIVAVFAAVASQAVSDVGYALLNPRIRVR
jgi:peptide/nickel transport system permease protein